MLKDNTHLYVIIIIKFKYLSYCNDRASEIICIIGSRDTNFKVITRINWDVALFDVL
jgi:hypothetical protein